MDEPAEWFFRRGSITPLQNSAFTFFHLVRILCALPLESRKKIINMFLMRDLWNFNFFDRGDASPNPFRTLSLCFGVMGKTPGPISRSKFVKKKKLPASAIAIVSWLDILFAQVSRSVEQNVHTTFSFLNPLSESEELQSWESSKILLSFFLRFDGHFWPNQHQQQCLPQFESILEGHLSRHLPAPFRLEIKNTN